MNNFIGNLSIKRKLLMTLIFPSVVSLFFAGLFLVMLEIAEFQKNTRDNLSTLAMIIGNRSTAALLFQDTTLANENLGVLKALWEVKVACLYDRQGAVFAKLLKVNDAELDCPMAIDDERTEFDTVYLHIVQPIIVDSERLGAVYIYADFRNSYWQKIKFIGELILVLVGASILASFLTSPLLRLISLPVKKLLETVKAISDTKNYSLRAVKVNNDELGVLVEAFNDLIGIVEAQNQSLTRAKDRYLALFDDNPTMVFNLSNAGVILSINRTGAKQLGLTVDEIQDCSVFGFINLDDLLVMEGIIENCLAMPASVYKQELRLICENGRVIWVRATARVFENEQRLDSLLLVCEDITETRELSEQIAYQATHDALTGLANRGQFDIQIKEAIAMACTDNSEHAVCYLDLDQFKVVNDTCGHLAGDELLRQLGELFRKNLRRHDFIARLGGGMSLVF
ncbi:MAG: diguanylate cyclase [Methylococcales bacterium]